MSEIEIGAPAPDFTLPKSGGGTLSLSDLRGRKIVLYFYPKDDTSGCTTQACGLRDVYPRIEAKDAVVLGVSPDGVKSHDRFAARFELPFPLLADEDHAVAEAYGVWKERSMYGKTFMGIERSTFLIDENGKIERVWRGVKPAQHAADMLAALGAA